jgi:hypothetical protein
VPLSRVRLQAYGLAALQAPIAAAKPHVRTSRAAVIPQVDASGNDVPRATYAKTGLQADAAAPSDSYLQNSRPDRPASH